MAGAFGGGGQLVGPTTQAFYMHRVMTVTSSRFSDSVAALGRSLGEDRRGTGTLGYLCRV